MGLFDPPAAGIRKCLPTLTYADFDRLESWIDETLSSHFDRTKRGLIIGYVAAAWALGEHRAERISLDAAAGNYISNMGSNCASMLRSDLDVALELVRHLISEGVIQD